MGTHGIDHQSLEIAVVEVILSLERIPCPLWMILMRHPACSIFFVETLYFAA